MLTGFETKLAYIFQYITFVASMAARKIIKIINDNTEKPEILTSQFRENVDFQGFAYDLVNYCST